MNDTTRHLLIDGIDLVNEHKEERKSLVILDEADNVQSLVVLIQNSHLLSDPESIIKWCVESAIMRGYELGRESVEIDEVRDLVDDFFDEL